MPTLKNVIQSLFTERKPVDPVTSHSQAPGLSSLEREDYLKNMEMARQVQQRLLSVDVAFPDTVKVAKRCVPAEAIGGDFYSFIVKDHAELAQTQVQPGVIEYVDTSQNYLGVVMGDVAGHGISSAMVMALSAGIFNEIGLGEKSPATVVEKANRSILHFIEQTQISYVTACYAVINIEKRELIFTRAGHPPIIHVKRDGSMAELEAEGLFLGMFHGETYSEQSLQLEKGDRLIFYTDGLTEARNAKDEEFGLNRMKGLIKQYHGSKTPEALIDIIFSRVSTHMQGTPVRDDQTMVIVEMAA